MSTTKIGEIAPFPPLPGQPYPPARNHPRWKELYRLHDEWVMKYWPFSSERKRARIPFMNLAGFSTWCAPAGDFDRMVWGARIAGVFFLADDYIDSGKMLDRIPGFKKAAAGKGPLHLEDRAELCHDVVFRAIKATAHPRTFDQLTKCTHEWWDSNIHEPFADLDQYLATRRVNIAMYFANAYFRYTLDLNLSDEQVNHPLMREAEGVVSDHVGLVNDYFSYAKEKLTNSDDTNVLRILQDHQGLTYYQAKNLVENKIRQKEKDFIPAGMAVLNHPELGKDPEVRRWIACLPYCMGGNIAWSQESGRYNIGDIPGGVPFPKLAFEAEPTPEVDLVDDTEESRLRDLVFNIEHVPEPELSPDVGAIESGSRKIVTKSGLIASSLLDLPKRPRPENVGIIAIEIALRKSLGVPPRNELMNGVRKDLSTVIPCAMLTLLSRYAIEPTKIGRVHVAIADTAEVITGGIANMLRSSGNVDVEVIVSGNSQYTSVSAFVSAVNWIESNSWDGRYALLFVRDYETDVAVLIGADAPIVLEPYRGYSLKCSASRSQATTVAAIGDTFEEAFSFYQRKRDACLSASELSVLSEIGAATAFFAFDYMIYNGAHEEILRRAQTDFYEEDHQVLKTKDIWTVPKDLDTSSTLQHTDKASPLTKLAFLIDAVPSYDLFEKRIALFAYSPGDGGSCLSLRVKGDTKYIRDIINLSNRKSGTRRNPPIRLSISNVGQDHVFYLAFILCLAIQRIEQNILDM